MRTRVLVALAVTALGASCTSSPETPDESAAQTRPADLECVVQQYPCSLADVPLEIVERSDTLGNDVLAMFESGSSTADAAAWLDAQEGMAQVEHDEDAVRFRLDGGRGTWVLKEGLADTRGSPGSGALGDGLAGQGGKLPDTHVVSDPDDGRRALVLSPFVHEFAPWDEGTAVANILAHTHGYEERVDYYANDLRYETTVNPDSFKGWDRYQVIHVATHGVNICDVEKDTLCRGGIASNVVHGGFPQEKGVVVPWEWAKNFTDTGAEVAKAAGDRGLDLDTGEPDIYVLLTADFFRKWYPHGLDNTLIYISGCWTIGADPSTDVAEALRGETSVFIGWDSTAYSNFAYSAALHFYTDLSEGGYAVDTAMQRLGELRTDPVGGQLLSSGRRSGGDLRIRDVVTALDPQTGCEMHDGFGTIDDPDNSVVLDGTIGDGVPDAVRYMVRVDGILPSESTDVLLKVRVMPAWQVVAELELPQEERPVRRSAIEPVPISGGRPLGDDAWLLEGSVPLGYDVDSTNQTHFLIAWIDLPDGGKSAEIQHFDVDWQSESQAADNPCLQTKESTFDFAFLEQRHNIWVRAEARGADRDVDEYQMALESFDADRSTASTRTVNGEPQVIDPLGLSGYSEGPAQVAAQATDATASASASLNFETTVTASKVRIAGLYERTVVGSASGDGGAYSVGLASSGVLFSFTGGLMHVVVAWSCELDLGLMVVEDGEQTDVLIDNHADACAGRFEGTLQPDTVYQLLASVGISDERAATYGRVTDFAGNVFRDDAAEFNLTNSGDFRLDLTPAG